MAKREPFDYKRFRRQAVQHLRMGADVDDLLAPVIRDLLETALRPDDPIRIESVSNRAPAEVNECLLSKTLPGVNQSTPTGNTLSVARSEPQTAFRNPRERCILDLFELGLTYEEILRQPGSIHTDMDVADLKKITDQILPQIRDWCERRLEPVYAYLWITRIPCRFQPDAQKGSCSAYGLFGIDLHGHRDILGYYFENSNGPKIWSAVLNNLRERGVEDILIAGSDEPTLLSDEFEVMYPQTRLHASIMLQLQSSLPDITGADQELMAKGLRALRDTAGAAEAKQFWRNFRAEWAERYPSIIEKWDRNWIRLIDTMDYPPLVRDRIHRFSFLEALQQKLYIHQNKNGPYLSTTEFSKAAYYISQFALSKHKPRVNRWGLMAQELSVLFGERAKTHRMV